MSSPSRLLPPEITLNIISRLPVESVFVCRRVCKTWRTLLVLDIDTYFADMHLRRQLLQLDYYYRHINDNEASGPTKVSFLAFSRSDEQSKLYYVEYDMNTGHCFDKSVPVSKIIINKPPRFLTNDYHIIGSCNGLICFTSRDLEKARHDDPVYICNPVTREYVYLPRFNVRRDTKIKYSRIASGFGYLPSTNKYKVVRIYDEQRDTIPWVGRVQVYTLGDGNGWRDRGEINIAATGGYFTKPRPGIPLNGAIYWLISERTILVFDLLDEEVRVLPLPSPNWGSKLCVLRGLLCLVHPRDEEITDMWTLRQKKYATSSDDYDVQEQDSQSWGWSKEINMEIKGAIGNCCGIYVRNEPLALTNSGEIVFWYEGTLVRYDPKTSNSTKLGNFHLASFPGNQVIPHVNSFVSLKALGEDAKIISTEDDGVLDSKQTDKRKRCISFKRKGKMRCTHT